MSKFKLGEKIVAIKNHYAGRFKIGDIFIVDGFACCPKCGTQGIFLKGLNPNMSGTKCVPCNIIISEPLNCYRESNFEKLISLGETTEYRLKVSIPELTEIKTPQLT